MQNDADRNYFVDSLFIFPIQKYQYSLELSLVSREDTEEKWESMWLSKYKNEDKLTFHDDKVCGGVFALSSVEILEVFNRAVRFSLVGSKTGQLLCINVTFSQKSSVQQFFRDIRSQQNRVIIFLKNESAESNRCKGQKLIFKILIQQCGARISMGKLFQYQILYVTPPANPLQQLTTNIEIYPKMLSANWFGKSKTINFVHYDINAQSEIVELVLLSKTFNISAQIGTNKVMLCSESIKTHIFFLSFRDCDDVRVFDEFIADDLDDRISCDSKKRLTYQLYRELNKKLG